MNVLYKCNCTQSCLYSDQLSHLEIRTLRLPLMNTWHQQSSCPEKCEMLWETLCIYKTRFPRFVFSNNWVWRKYSVIFGSAGLAHSIYGTHRKHNQLEYRKSKCTMKKTREYKRSMKLCPELLIYRLLHMYAILFRFVSYEYDFPKYPRNISTKINTTGL